MKRVFLRILAYALCMTLLLGALPARAAGVQYDLFITDVRVTEENRADILGDGVFRFDGDRTLVVQGDCDSPDLPVISSGIPGLVIRVQKPSTLSCGENPAILALADLTVTGPFALALESETNCGIFLRSCSLCVSRLPLFASGRWGLAGNEITDENCALRIDCADLSIESTDGAICDFAQGIELSSCAVTAPAEYVLGDYAIKTPNLRIARSVSIRHTGEMLAPSPYTHTVSFLNPRGNDPAPQTVTDGQCASAPALEDAAFLGWCTDPACTAPFDFSLPILENLTLYASWAQTPGQAADKTALDAAVAEAAAISAGDYTEASWQVLQAVLEQAREVAADEDASQTAVDAAVRSVRAALAALVPKSAEIDRTVLEQILSAAEALDLSDYTAESRAALQTALEAARTVLSGADQAAIDAAAQALLDAIAGLAPDAAPPVIDRAALEKALSEAEAIVKELYPAESVAALEAVIEAAKAILSDETAAQVVVDAMANAIEEALRALQEKASESFRFEDVQNPKTYYYDAVYWAYAARPQITNGVTPTAFWPDSGCTRGQVVTFLWRAAGCPAPANAGTGFSDVSPLAFYARAVAWAVEQGVTKGMTDTTFAPNAVCTRGQIVTFLWRSRGSPAPARTETQFADVPENAFYAKAVAWALETGVTKGMTDVSFCPNEICTRGQVVTFLQRAMAGE